MDEKEVWWFAATNKLLITRSTDILGEWGSPGKYVTTSDDSLSRYLHIYTFSRRWGASISRLGTDNESAIRDKYRQETNRPIEQEGVYWRES